MYSSNKKCTSIFSEKGWFAVMIYFSVDNDEHSNLATSIIKQCNLKKELVTFISHVSPRNNLMLTSNVKKIEILGHPLSAGAGYAQWASYIWSSFHQRELQSTFHFTCEDILIVITEYQLNNAIFAKKMKNAGGKVFLFDEGVGFYFNNSHYHSFRANRMDKFYLFLYNLAFYALRIPARARKGQEGRMFVCIQDALIDGVYSRFNIPINRQIPVYGYRSILNSVEGLKEANKKVAIFFATNFECFNLKDKEMRLAKSAIEKMASKFSEVYIKVHPSDVIEKNDVFAFYKSLKNENIRLMDNSLTAVEAMKTYRPAVVAGAVSSSLLDAIPLGCQPVFLFHMLPEILELGVFKFTLSNMKYNFIQSLDEIKPSYECKVDIVDLMNTGDLASHFFHEGKHDQPLLQASSTL